CVKGIRPRSCLACVSAVCRRYRIRSLVDLARDCHFRYQPVKSRFFLHWWMSQENNLLLDLSRKSFNESIEPPPNGGSLRRRSCNSYPCGQRSRCQGWSVGGGSELVCKLLIFVGGGPPTDNWTQIHLGSINQTMCVSCPRLRRAGNTC